MGALVLRAEKYVDEFQNPEVLAAKDKEAALELWREAAIMVLKNVEQLVKVISKFDELPKD